jgi:HSP20 family protein
MSEEKRELEVHHKTEIDRTAGEPTRDDVRFTPACDIYETPEGLVLVADVPGARSEDVGIDLDNRTLTLTARVPAVAPGRSCIYQEYVIGGYQREFTVGEAIDRTRISAVVKDGVLTVHLPKMDALKPRKIQVQGA